MLKAYGGEVDVPKLSFLATLHCDHALPALLLVEVVGTRQEDEPRLVLPIYAGEARVQECAIFPQSRLDLGWMC
jgi:hypothetical protein